MLCTCVIHIKQDKKGSEMEIVYSQTHILFKQTSNERLSSLGMKMLKQLNNRNVLDVALIELANRRWKQDDL